MTASAQFRGGNQNVGLLYVENRRIVAKAWIGCERWRMRRGWEPGTEEQMCKRVTSEDL